MSETIRHLRVAIIGTGFSGLGMAIRLKQEGEEDFLVFERAAAIGGTWRDNTYPGCACDVMALLYSYSFAQNPDWKSTFAKQEEVLDYLRDCVDRFELHPHLRFGHALTGARWDRLTRRWHIATSQGDYTARVLVTGTGYLSDPKIPDLPGLDSFTGEVFHSSNWNHDFPLEGKRVAVVGTGASAIQFVPEVQKVAGHVDLYQRTAPWVAPKPDLVITPAQRKRRRNMPTYQNFRRNFNMWGREIVAFLMSDPARADKTIKGMAEKNLQKQVTDPVLRAKLTPDYSVGCKRLLFSNNWYQAIQEPNVEVVTDGIAKIGPDSIVTTDGQERQVDAIIMGTGFRATDRPVAKLIHGRDGVSLSTAWSDGMTGYRGTTVAGFPNLFMLLGPNTTLGHSSQTVMIEAQLAYVIDALAQMKDRDLASVEVRPEAQQEYNTWLDGALDGTVWNSGGCRNWYVDATGRNSSIFPTYTWRFRRNTRRFDLASYQIATSAGTERLLEPTR
ncbi:flavin-containing monooxygenase [Actinoplanes couchii]|uniref:Baeyer-Villiger monooxygenase n=1 Tax=Actinoplanes couchii TaxID=403638 RepID=A0ABQ3X1X1_9ACTN|nr:NAD(P)/FAD-dependent oxidoreductase [Actinoplanes couchii]MDR6316856.1 cation diffusion facilitator CzcD-associated flavoprotein CzcO [Actinoplanes couchii]GID52463.1 Baeyer-Villiger monooxygenase [Actinoplanes couchii]